MEAQIARELLSTCSRLKNRQVISNAVVLMVTVVTCWMLFLMSFSLRRVLYSSLEIRHGRVPLSIMRGCVY